MKKAAFVVAWSPALATFAPAIRGFADRRVRGAKSLPQAPRRTVSRSSDLPEQRQRSNVPSHWSVIRRHDLVVGRRSSVTSSSSASTLSTDRRPSCEEYSLCATT